MQADLFVAQCDFYLAGPEEFVETVALALREAGVAQGQIFEKIL